MKITWFGHAASRLLPVEGPGVITDPYTPEGVGYAPIRETFDLVIISSDDDDAHCRADLIVGDPAVVNALEVAQNGGATTAAGTEVTAIKAAEIKDEDVDFALGHTIDISKKDIPERTRVMVMDYVR